MLLWLPAIIALVALSTIFANSVEEICIAGEWKEGGKEGLKNKSGLARYEVYPDIEEGSLEEFRN